jgi:hypothetical protein
MTAIFDSTNNYKDFFFNDKSNTTIPIISYILIPSITLLFAFRYINHEKETTFLEKITSPESPTSAPSPKTPTDSPTTGGYKKTKTKKRKHNKINRRSKRQRGSNQY